MKSDNSCFILGISAFYHDSSASLLNNGEIIAASSEERFTRKKGDSSFPHLAIEYALSEAGITINDVDYIVFYDKPIKKFDRIIASFIHSSPLGVRSFLKSIPLWLKDKLWIENYIQKELGVKKDILFTEHHISHAASAFYPSPFKDAAILTIDGAGEWATTTIGYGRGNELQILKEIHFPHSLGLLYSAFTQYCGFRVNSGEYKLMGLAPYGKPVYAGLIKKEIITIFDDGSFTLNNKYFNYISGLTMINKKFQELFGHKALKYDEFPDSFFMDIASSIQSVTNEVVVKLARTAVKVTGCSNLVLAGGVALNCVANSEILKNSICENIWIQPAAGDAGGSLGAAFYVYHGFLRNKRVCNGKDDIQKGSYLGPVFSGEVIRDYLDNNGFVYEKACNDEELVIRTASILSKENVVGWYHGRMEYGPRALGNRSILADPRSAMMQKNLNLKIKYRESFRPFAPSILKEFTKEYFKSERDSNYMLFTTQLADDKLIEYDRSLFGMDLLKAKRSILPAITHVDNSARFHTVDKETNSLFYSLLKEFYNLTGCPILINTSFNVRGEPIVCTPKDALNCFMGTEMDVLVIGSFILFKENQKNKVDLSEWKKKIIQD